MVKRRTKKKTETAPPVPTKSITFDLAILGTATATEAEARIRACHGRHPFNGGGVCTRCGVIKLSAVPLRDSLALKVTYELPAELAL